MQNLPMMLLILVCIACAVSSCLVAKHRGYSALSYALFAFPCLGIVPLLMALLMPPADSMREA